MSDREKERAELRQALMKLGKQQVDALYRMAEIESTEMAEIRALAGRIQAKSRRLGRRDKLITKTLKVLDKLIDSYLEEGACAPEKEMDDLNESIRQSKEEDEDG